MTNTMQALYRFFSGFDLPAYVENYVPDDAVLPYITYQVMEPDWRDEAQKISARVWYKDTSYQDISAKVDEIKRAVGECVSISTDGGAVYLYPDRPFAQDQPVDDDTIKVAYLLLTIIAHER